MPVHSDDWLPVLHSGPIHVGVDMGGWRELAANLAYVFIWVKALTKMAQL